MTNDRDELLDWIARFREGQLGPDEAAALNDRLAADPQAREVWVSYLLMQTLLENELAQDVCGDPDSCEDLALESDCGAGGCGIALPEAAWEDLIAADDEKPASAPVPRSPVLGFLGDLGRQGWGFCSDNATLFSGLAALLAVSLTIFGTVRYGQSLVGVAESPRFQSPAPKSSDSVARLIRVADCRWADESLEPGDRVTSGQSLHLASGVAEVRFDVGVRMVLQGPASLKVESAESARLCMGKLTAEITNPAARGFKIYTPEATVVDQGTEFGVEVTRGNSSRVHVFKGEVDLALNNQKNPPCRLVANCGARLEGKLSNMTLLKDTGESFIRSMDQAGRDRHTVAYWRFEDRPLGMVLPDTSENTCPVRATMDSSFNGNDLFTFSPRHGPQFSEDVANDIVPQTGIANESCLDNSVPPYGVTTRDVYTHSQFSHAAPLDLQKITPAQWTIEISVKPVHIHCGPQTFVCRDGVTGEQPRLVFQINDDDQFAVAFVDVENRLHEAVASNLQLKERNHWYHLAAVSDGRTLKLYVDCQEGRGYQLEASTELPATGSTALGKATDLQEWDIGRIRTPTDQMAQWFQGWIDEVRISDVALSPSEFLFTPRQAVAAGRASVEEPATATRRNP